jgi:uncharacterized membrane protein
MLAGAIPKDEAAMRRFVALAALLSLGLAACDPHAADSPGTSEPPADAPADAPAPTAASFDGDFKLVGTEPFWGLAIEGDQFVLERPGEKSVAAPRPAPVIEGASAHWDSGPLKVVLTPGGCSDGMSDRSYAYAATVTVGGATLTGCGDRPQALKAQPG